MAEIPRPTPPDLTKVTFERKGYESPYSTRYGSPEMRAIWDQKYRLYKCRRIWIAAAHVQMKAGQVTEEEYNDLVAHREDIDVDDINRRENDINHPNYVGHDVIAHIEQYASVAKIGGKKLHRTIQSWC